MKTFCLLLPVALCAAAASLAQPPSSAPPDSSVHVVTYLDLLPSQAEAGRTLLVQQIRTEHNQPGCRTSELLQEQGRGNHFMLVETWNDAAGLEAYHASEGYRQFRASLQPALASPLDERRAQEITATEAEDATR